MTRKKPGANLEKMKQKITARPYQFASLISLICMSGGACSANSGQGPPKQDIRVILLLLNSLLNISTHFWLFLTNTHTHTGVTAQVLCVRLVGWGHHRIHYNINCQGPRPKRKKQRKKEKKRTKTTPRDILIKLSISRKDIHAHNAKDLCP